MLSRLRIFLAIAAVCLILCVRPVRAAAPENRALKVVYASMTLGGRRCLIAANGVSVENPASGVTVVSQAPDWTVYAYNVRSKLYFRCHVEDFPSDSYENLSRADVYTLTRSKWQQVGQLTVLNRHCVKYEMRRSAKAVAKSLGSSLVFAKYVAADDFNLSPRGQQLLAKVLHLPNQAGVPMMLSFYDQDDGWVHPLACRRIDVVTPPKDAFTLPVGYKLSKTEQAVFVDPMSKSVFQGLNDFTQTLAH
ncbi:MAG: hypothetical protein JSS86_01485 [Cyanobacteria bacterium SZAS LIN-2]|nr:hypothetical protein [Cyanobacteria bacterium SZAS LIN-2]